MKSPNASSSSSAVFLRAKRGEARGLAPLDLQIQTTRQRPAKESPKMPISDCPNSTAVPGSTIAEELKPLPLVIGFSLPMRA
jgi:hypothetical protein